MSSLSFLEKQKLESILWMAWGWVLDFTNRVFAECVQDTTKIDIYSWKYSNYGESKAKLLRSFWEIESDITVGKLLNTFADYASNNDIRVFANRILWQKEDAANLYENLDSIVLPKITLNRLMLFPDLEEVIKQRIHDIEISIKNWAYLSSVILTWSTLEWILFHRISTSPQLSNTANSAPKDKAWKVKNFNEWSLSDMINTLHELWILDKNIVKFSHALREFRNYIHPFQQSVEKFNPDKHTAEISYKILILAIDQLS